MGEMSSVKPSYIGAPAIFALEQACKHVKAAFRGFGCFIVGSSLDRPDWRDVDVRCILSDEEFGKLFPDVVMPCWEQDERWLLLTVSISLWLKRQTGLPIDFQIQPQTHANERHKGKRNAIGMMISQKATRDYEGEIKELKKLLSDSQSTLSWIFSQTETLGSEYGMPHVADMARMQSLSILKVLVPAEDEK